MTHRVEQIGRRPLMKAVSATVLSASGERLADFRHAADANLFVAAPELLAALKALTDFLESELEGDASHPFHAEIERAKAAITKATT